MAVSVSSGRYSKYPKVNREIQGAVAAEALVDPVETEAEALAALLAALEAESQGEGQGEVETPKATIDVPELSVKKLLAWVGDDEDRRLAALEAELAGEHRATAIRALTVA